jgi:hypothetical protein
MPLPYEIQARLPYEIQAPLPFRGSIVPCWQPVLSASSGVNRQVLSVILSLRRISPADRQVSRQRVRSFVPHNDNGHLCACDWSTALVEIQDATGRCDWTV